MTGDAHSFETMPDTPQVSVVIPSCNRRDMLERCLESLIRQTLDDFEVIVVDDGSTDSTLLMLEEFSAKNQALELEVLSNSTNLGANPSRNRGVGASSAPLVAFLDSDCSAEPHWLENLIREFSDEHVAATTGLVIDTQPSNIYELTFRGTHRIFRDGDINRLIGGNMCVRKELLNKFRWDEDRAQPELGHDGRPDISVSGRGDEEGLHLRLKAAGYGLIGVLDAVVHHDHHFTPRAFFAQAFRGGRSAAKLVYKYYLRQRLDMLPFVLTYCSLPLMLIDARFGYVSAFFFVGALAAITYNDLFRKRKTLAQTLLTFPILLAYYHVRLLGYGIETLRLRVTRHDIRRVRLSAGG